MPGDPNSDYVRARCALLDAADAIMLASAGWEIAVT